MKQEIKIGCLYNKFSERAVLAFNELVRRYNAVEFFEDNKKHLDIVITLGGDGEILKALHATKDLNTPIFGLNRGSLGFLLNDYCKLDKLIERIQKAISIKLYPLKMRAITENDEVTELYAFNEVSLLRETNQAAKIRIYIDGIVRMNSLQGDGVLISTPAGSTAYNFAAAGPILPLTANLLSITPISPFRPRRWSGALIHNDNVVKFEIIDNLKRPVSVVADSQEIRNIKSVEVFLDFNTEKKLLFDIDNNFQERVFKEQFYKE
ncbi:MAG: NAD+ kinase [Candidatus Midichloriaceae bacterium]|jgi:NAD+ kinase